MFFSTIATAAGFRGPAKITSFTINYHNYGIAIVFNNSVDPNNCGTADWQGTDVIINRTLDGYKEIYAAILTAHSLGKTVDVWLDGTCQNYRNVGTAVSVVP
jgi:hypothetical protein